MALRTLALIALSNIFGCQADFVTGGYTELGTFDTKIDAQNRAIVFIVGKYGSLPEKDYKVRYSFRDGGPSVRKTNALWYDKKSAGLALEIDINSGPVCRWRDVDRSILEKASLSVNGLAKIDSVAKPNQPMSQCM